MRLFIILLLISLEIPCFAEINSESVWETEFYEHIKSDNFINGVGFFHVNQQALDAYNKSHEQKFELSQMNNFTESNLVGNWILNVEIPKELKSININPSAGIILKVFKCGGNALTVNGKCQNFDTYLSKYIEHSTNH